MIVYIPMHYCGQQTEILGVFTTPEEARLALRAGLKANPYWSYSDTNIELWEIGRPAYPRFQTVDSTDISAGQIK